MGATENVELMSLVLLCSLGVLIPALLVLLPEPHENETDKNAPHLLVCVWFHVENLFSV